MDILKETVIWEEIFKEYDRKPLSWYALEYDSLEGFKDLLIFDPGNAFLLKKDSVYGGAPTVIGVRLDETDMHKTIFDGEGTVMDITRLPSYGLRGVAIKPIMKKIERFVDEGRDPVKIFDMFFRLRRKAEEGAMRTPPVRRKSMVTRYALVGPYIQVGLDTIPKEQRDVSRDLDEELRRILRRKYPMVV